jgi:hypothetical protein
MWAICAALLSISTALTDHKAASFFLMVASFCFLLAQGDSK